MSRRSRQAAPQIPPPAEPSASAAAVAAASAVAEPSHLPYLAAERPFPELDAETEGINTYAEGALHAALKASLARPGDRLEVSVEGRIIDLVRASGELVEIQTKRLDKIAPKVLELAAKRAVRIVHPIAVETRILRLDPGTGELLSERKSPKRGDFYSLFDELVRAPSLIAARNVTIELLLVRARELRTRDGSGSWRRRGDRVLARELVEVLESRSLGPRKDWLGLLPAASGPPWDSASLGSALGIGPERARKLLYSLCKAGLLSEAGKAGRRKLYETRSLPRGRAARKKAAARD